MQYHCSECYEELYQVFFVHHRTVSAVKRVDFVSDSVLYTVLRVSWCNIIVLNVHTPIKRKVMIQKTV